MQTTSAPNLATPGRVAGVAQPSAAPGLSQAQAAHSAASAQFDQVEAAKSMLDHIKAELDVLTRLGDMITPEDVIEGAGKLVAHGAPAGQMAALLSSMPQASGAGLQAWVAQQEAFVAQKEAELMPAHAVLGHRMAQSALGVLQQAGAGGGSPAQAGPADAGAAPSTPLSSGASALNIQNS